MILPLVVASGLSSAPPLEIHLSPSGDDRNPGTLQLPLASLHAARDVLREHAGKRPVRIVLHGGTYRLPKTLTFRGEDSGTAAHPVIWEAAPGEKVVVSGGVEMKLAWEKGPDGIWSAPTEPGLDLDQIFVNGERMHMARYPNFDPKGGKFDGSAADAISPERTARWSDPAGGYVHAMHVALWGDMHWRILGKMSDGSLEMEGGWQNNRPSVMHKDFRFVENIREELDAPGEWFHDRKANRLLFIPPAFVDLAVAKIEGVRLSTLISLRGTRENPVRHLRFVGIEFRHARRGFMENKERLLRTDWTIQRDGAVFVTGAEDCSIEGCRFEGVGGNTIFVSGYARRVEVRRCLIRESGANGVAFVGDPSCARDALVGYESRQSLANLDRTPGPKGEDFPADCLVEDCLITRTGRVEKQTAPIEIDLSRRITVRHCSIYEVPRAGINIGDGCWGGHVVEGCDVFDTVLETGDHGSFNSWGRDRFWGLKDASASVLPELALLDAVEPNVLRRNRWRCDHGWDVDLDDGSSHYVIEENLLLGGGLKWREGFHRTGRNNVIVNNSLHPHVWYPDSGDVFEANIVMGPYRPARMAAGRWGKRVDGNLFSTSEADRARFASNGCDASSLVGDPGFLDAPKGDFRVREDSPALRLGFANFPMDAFGVRDPALKALARTPAIPALIAKKAGGALSSGKPMTRAYSFLQATVSPLEGEEYSAFGVDKATGGMKIVDCPEASFAHRIGLRPDDLILRWNGVALLRPSDLERARDLHPDGAFEIEGVRHQSPFRKAGVGAP